MKSIISITIIAATLGTGCASRVPTSFSGVLVNNWASDDKGAITPKGRGLVWYNPFTQDLYVFPLHLQQISYTAVAENDITVRAGKDNTTVSFDAGLSYQFAESKVPDIFKKYRTDPNTLATGYVYRELRSAFNQAAADYAVMDLLGSRLTEMQAKAQDILKKKLEPEGIIVDQLLITGQPRIDPNIEKAINQTLQQVQQANRAEQRIREVMAEANQRREAANGEKDAAITRAQGQAEAARLLQAQLTPLVIQKQALDKWNGQLPTVTGGRSAVHSGSDHHSQIAYIQVQEIPHE